MSRLDAFRRWWAMHSVPAEIRVLFALHHGECFTWDICREYQVGISTIFPMLARLEGLWVVESEWRDWVEPRRREYRLTLLGAQALERAILQQSYGAHWARVQAIHEWREGRA